MINTKNLKHKKNKHKPFNKLKPHLEKVHSIGGRVKEVCIEIKGFSGRGGLKIYKSLHMKGINFM